MTPVLWYVSLGSGLGALGDGQTARGVRAQDEHPVVDGFGELRLKGFRGATQTVKSGPRPMTAVSSSQNIR